jgi:cobalt/nickel transport system permease protein
MKQTLFQQAGELYGLEELAQGNTLLHRRHPGVKLFGTLLYLLAVLGVGRYELGQLLSLSLYPVVLMALGELPWRLVWRRTAVALPFCLFAGLSNLVLDRQVVTYLGTLPITGGLLSCGSILLRTVLCVLAVLLLVALTPMTELTGLLRRCHVPGSLVSLFEMTYRYVGTLIEEAGRMTTAYHLRAPEMQGLDMGHMGAFLGSLLLRSHQRAQRVYQAMRLRGYGGAWSQGQARPMNGGDWLYLALVAGGSLLLGLVNVPEFLGRAVTCWM